MGLLASGQTWLGTVMTAEGQSITYSRRSETISTTATPDDSQELAVTDTGLTVQTDGIDFVMDLANLGSLSLPQDGDVIVWDARAYRVLPSSNGRCFDWMDNRRFRVAIHTKQVPK